MAKIEVNVQEYILGLANKVGERERIYFARSFYHLFDDDKALISSPIEQILYSTLFYLRKINRLLTPTRTENKHGLYGLIIEPQYSIGKYRVDFLCTYYSVEGHMKSVIVECDSKQFHDRTETDRTNEKKRERFMQSLGYHIFRFTGAEINKNPIAVCKEILSHLVNTKYTGIDF